MLPYFLCLYILCAFLLGLRMPFEDNASFTQQEHRRAFRIWGDVARCLRVRVPPAPAGPWVPAIFMNRNIYVSGSQYVRIQRRGWEGSRATDAMHVKVW